MKSLFKNRRGFAIDDFGSMLFGLGCIAIALLLLFSIGKWQKVKTENNNEDDLFIVRTNRLFLSELNTPAIDSTNFLLADKIMLAKFSEKDRNELEIYLKDFLKQNNNPYTKIKITSDKDIINIKDIVPATPVPNFYLPSLDGGIIEIHVEG